MQVVLHKKRVNRAIERAPDYSTLAGLAEFKIGANAV